MRVPFVVHDQSPSVKRMFFMYRKGKLPSAGKFYIKEEEI